MDMIIHVHTHIIESSMFSPISYPCSTYTFTRLVCTHTHILHYYYICVRTRSV